MQLSKAPLIRSQGRDFVYDVIRTSIIHSQFPTPPSCGRCIP